MRVNQRNCVCIWENCENQSKRRVVCAWISWEFELQLNVMTADIFIAFRWCLWNKGRSKPRTRQTTNSSTQHFSFQIDSSRVDSAIKRNENCQTNRLLCLNQCVLHVYCSKFTLVLFFLLFFSCVSVRSFVRQFIVVVVAVVSCKI